LVHAEANNKYAQWRAYGDLVGVIARGMQREKRQEHGRPVAVGGPIHRKGR
jgi:hypothetical protein